MALANVSYGQDANNAELADRLLQASLGMPVCLVVGYNHGMTRNLR
jgi:hypothetical protein